MEIIVLVKQVPDTTEIKIDPKTHTLIRTGVKNIINPDDLAGIEEALKLKERYNGRVTTITMGPPQAMTMIKSLLARGVDQAYLLTDRRFAGSDTWATSYILSQLIQTLDYDLIIAGYQAIDGDTAQVGPQVAEFLDLPQATHVTNILSMDQKHIILDKSYEKETHTLSIELPCLITTLQSMNQPRLMNAYDIFNMDESQIHVLGFDDLPMNETMIGLKGSPTRVKKTFTKEVIKKSPQETLTPQKAVDKIIKLIKPYMEV